jgi:hypothetical protein
MSDKIELTDEQPDALTEGEYLKSIGAIREDGTIDRTKIKYRPAQTFEELEALLWDDHTDG